MKLRNEIIDRLSATGIIPIIAIEKVEDALPLADALLAGGISIIEITFRTAAAAESIRTLARERPAMLVGAGTVLTPDNLRSAIDAGARFAVAPGLNPNMVKLAGELGLPFFPGVATPSEIELALAMGCRTLKFFPAEPLGGVSMLNALSAPYGHTGLKFVPTGGVSPGNVESYLSCKTVAAVGGTWLAKKEDLEKGKWMEIQNRCSAAIETVRHTREKLPKR